MTSTLTAAIEGVIKAYSSDPGSGLHIRPYMDLQKASSFTDHINKRLSININVDDVHVLVDDGASATRGIAITSTHLLFSAGDKQIAAHNIANVISASLIAGWFSKYITVTLTSGECVTFGLDYLNKRCATSVAEIISKISNVIRSHKTKPTATDTSSKVADNPDVILDELHKAMLMVPGLLDLELGDGVITGKYVDKEGDAVALLAEPRQHEPHLFCLALRLPLDCWLGSLIAANSWNSSQESPGTFSFVVETDGGPLAILAASLTRGGADALMIQMQNMLGCIDAYEAHIALVIGGVGSDSQYIKPAHGDLWSNIGRFAGSLLGAALLVNLDDDQ